MCASAAREAWRANGWRAPRPLFGAHLGPEDLRKALTLIQDLSTLVNTLANLRTSLSGSTADGVATAFSKLIEVECKQSRRVDGLCGVAALVEPTEAYLRPLANSVFRGEFREAALQLAKSQLAPVEEDEENTCTPTREERRFFLSFAAFVLDDSTSQGSRDAVREGFRSSAVDLISCFTSDGYKLMTKPGWRTISVAKTFTPTLGKAAAVQVPHGPRRGGVRDEGDAARCSGISPGVRLLFGRRVSSDGGQPRGLREPGRRQAG